MGPTITRCSWRASGADSGRSFCMNSRVDAAPLLESPASPFRAWLTLLLLSVRRQARMRQMVWIAVGLMALTVLFVRLNTYFGRWTLTDRRARPYGMNYHWFLLQTA